MDTQLFPLPFKTHIIFGVICILFFLFQYYRLKYRYEMYMALAVAATFLLYVSDSDAVFIAIGITEAVLLLLAFISAQRVWAQERREEKAEKAAKAAAENASEIVAENAVNAETVLSEAENTVQTDSADDAAADDNNYNGEAENQ